MNLYFIYCKFFVNLKHFELQSLYERCHINKILLYGQLFVLTMSVGETCFLDNFEKAFRNLSHCCKDESVSDLLDEAYIGSWNNSQTRPYLLFCHSWLHFIRTTNLFTFSTFCFYSCVFWTCGEKKKTSGVS